MLMLNSPSAEVLVAPASAQTAMPSPLPPEVVAVIVEHVAHLHRSCASILSPNSSSSSVRSTASSSDDAVVKALLKDLAACAIVSRSWQLGTTPVLYREVRFARLSSFKQFLNSFALPAPPQAIATEESTSLNAQDVTAKVIAHVRSESCVSGVRTVPSSAPSSLRRTVVRPPLWRASYVRTLIFAFSSEADRFGLEPTDLVRLTVSLPGLRTLDLGICNLTAIEMCTVVHGAAMGGGRLLSLKLSHGYRLSKSLAQVLGNVTLINEPDAPPPLHVRLDPECSSQPPSGNSIAPPGRTIQVPPSFVQQSEEGSSVKTSPSPFTLVRNYHCGLAYTVLSSLALLECLHLTHCYNLSSDEMSKLMHAFPGLKKLSLAGCGPAVADGVVEAIAETCVNLADLDLSECHFIGDASVMRLADHLGDRLKRLNLHYCDLVTDRGVSHLSKRCIKLEALDVANCDVGDDTICEIANNLSDSLQNLNVRECYRITDASIVYLFQRATKLKSVDLSFTNINDASLRELGNTQTLHPRQLQELALIACRSVSVCGLVQAARGCPRLQRVWIRRCRQMWASIKPAHLTSHQSSGQGERVPPLKEFLQMYPSISVDVDVDVDVEYDGGNGEDDANEGGSGEGDFDAQMRNLLAAAFATLGSNHP